MSSDPSQQSTYAHGYDPSVLRSHGSRTAANSCAYLLPHIQPNMRILDIGCGPGSITCDLAALVFEGSVIGIDLSDEVLDKAKQLATERGLDNVEFMKGDIYNLGFEEAVFDVVHAHQVLQHIGDPAKALREMMRVTKKGGLVANREAYVRSAFWYPDCPPLRDTYNLYAKTAASLGATPDAARMLHVFAKGAGCDSEDVTMSASCWCFRTKEELKLWCHTWADRLENSELRKNALQEGHASEEEIDSQAAAWRSFAELEDAMTTMPHMEILCHVK